MSRKPNDQESQTPSTQEPTASHPSARRKADRKELDRRWSHEIDATLDELRRLVKESGLSQRKIEKLAGFSKGYLSQLLSRNLDLKVRHVLAILDALDQSPGEFFARIFPAHSYPALERFQKTSRPLTGEMDEILGRLYQHSVESLVDLRTRLKRCEEAISKLEKAIGFLDDGAGRKR